MRAFNTILKQALPVLLLLPLFVSSARADKVEIREWKVPFEVGRTRDPDVAPDGSVWFVDQQEHYLARFDAGSEKFSRYALPDAAGPHNLIVGRDGIVWYAGNRAGYIGRFDPARDTWQKIAMPDGIRDPHTLVFDGDQKHIWFTAQWSNLVGRLTISNLDVDVVPMPTEDARPYGIVVAANGRPWIAPVGTNQLVSINPETLKLTAYELPDLDAAPRRIAVTSDNQVYYVDYSLGRLGHLDPVSGKVRQWPTPSGPGSGPYAMAVDDKDRLWFVETGESPNRLAGFSSRTGRFVSGADIPSGGGSVRHMVFDKNRNSLWFGTDVGTLGQAVLP